MIDHIGIAVNNLEEAFSFYQKILGVQQHSIVEARGGELKILIFNLGDIKIELIQTFNELSDFGKFLKDHGEGFHHVAFKVPNLNESIERVKENGCTNEIIPRPGVDGTRIAFLEPDMANGVLIELVEVKD